jgi:hypothetical protein
LREDILKKIIIILSVLIFLNIFIVGCFEKNDMSIDYFIVQPDIIQKGDSATLSWKVTGASSIFIDNNIGNISHNDSTIIQPDVNTTYTITASNNNKIINSSITIIVENLEQEIDRETPKVNMTAKSFNDNKSVLIEIDKVSKFGVEWATISGKLIDIDFGEAVNFINVDWKPNGLITIGDEIILSNSMIKTNLIAGKNYSFELTYQLNNKQMGIVTWTQ